MFTRFCHAITIDTASLCLRGPARYCFAVWRRLIFEAGHHCDAFGSGRGHGGFASLPQIATERLGVVLGPPIRASRGGDEPVAEDILGWRGQGTFLRNSRRRRLVRDDARIVLCELDLVHEGASGPARNGLSVTFVGIDGNEFTRPRTACHEFRVL